MFDSTSINFKLLRERAYNLRWATVPDGVIPLTAADPDFPSAPQISNAIKNFSSDRYFCYGPPEGLAVFKESIANFYQQKRSVPVQAEYSLPVNSAAYGIYITCKAFLSPGDQAIIFDPVDFLFRYSVEAVGAEALPFAIPPGNSKLDEEALENLITNQTKMICLCNPLNPTGKVFSREELTLIGEIACKHELVILSDEIWSDIVFEPAVFTSIASINEPIRSRTITVTGFSKSYGLAGLRIGAVMAHSEAHFKLLLASSLHESTIEGVSVLSQIAAATALNECSDWLSDFLGHLTKMKLLLADELNSIPGFSCIPPQGCYVAFTDIRGTGLNSTEIQKLLLNEAKVAVVPGLKQWFGDGAEGYIRMSFATSEDVLREAMERIKNVLG